MSIWRIFHTPHSQTTYTAAIKRLEEMRNKYDMDERDAFALMALYDDYYWSVQENVRLQHEVERLRAESTQAMQGDLIAWWEKHAKMAAGRVGLAGLIPATYKPMKWLITGLRQYSAED